MRLISPSPNWQRLLPAFVLATVAGVVLVPERAPSQSGPPPPPDSRAADYATALPAVFQNLDVTEAQARAIAVVLATYRVQRSRYVALLRGSGAGTGSAARVPMDRARVADTLGAIARAERADVEALLTPVQRERYRLLAAPTGRHGMISAQPAAPGPPVR